METKNKTYLFLTIILLILSAIGGYFLFQNFKATNQISYSSNVVPKIEMIPTDAPSQTELVVTPKTAESTISARNTISPVATISTTKITPTKLPTKKPTLIPTKSVTPTLSVTKGLLDYSNSTDGFTLSYSSSRKFIQDVESSGNRYTFSGSSGNFAVHVSPSGQWAWTYPDRQFNTNFTVSNQPTFRYDISSQTIVDFQSSDKNYTIQCVHNGNTTLKAECEAFLASFKLL